MCDYSLHGIENRLAVQGENLVVYRFYTGSKGLTSPAYLESSKPATGFLSFLTQKLVETPSACAVCIPDGAKLQLTGISSELQDAYGVSESETVTFRQITANEAMHRDAVEFRNGMTVGLQKLTEGQRVEVLALSSDESAVVHGLTAILEWR